MYKRNSNLIHLFLYKKFAKKGDFYYEQKISGIFQCKWNNKKVAGMIAEEAKADLFEIEPKVPYTRADLSIHFWKPIISAVKRSSFLQHPVEVDSVIL